MPPPVQQITVPFNWLIEVGSWTPPFHRYELIAGRLIIEEDDEETVDEDDGYVLDPNAVEGTGYDSTHVPRGYETGN